MSKKERGKKRKYIREGKNLISSEDLQLSESITMEVGNVYFIGLVVRSNK